MSARPSSTGLFAETASTTPHSGWISAHCDGGARGNPGPAGFGAVITDTHGTLIAELSEFLGIRTNNYAEYSGLLAVLDYAVAHNHSHVRVISDSELMVKQIQGKYKVNSPDLKILWQQAKERIARLEAFEISHALRHKNKDADRLANQAMDRGMKRPHTPGTPAPPLKATPYPTRATAPPVPATAAKALDPGTAKAVMLRGFTRDGVVHLLGGASLPDGVFVKILPE